MDIGKKLAELRESKGWSQYRLAKESGIKQGAISNLELGKRPNPTSETLQKLCTALGVSMSEFDDSTSPDLHASAMAEAEKMKLNEQEKAALERLKAMPLDEQQRRLLEKYNSLPPETRKAIDVILRSLSASQ